VTDLNREQLSHILMKVRSYPSIVKETYACIDFGIDTVLKDNFREVKDAV